MLAEVKTLYPTNARMIVETLRRHADEIEKGVRGNVEALVIVELSHKPVPGPHKDGEPVTHDEEIIVYGLGDTSFWHSLGILQGGLTYLTRMIKS